MSLRIRLDSRVPLSELVITLMSRANPQVAGYGRIDWEVLDPPNSFKHGAQSSSAILHGFLNVCAVFAIAGAREIGNRKKSQAIVQLAWITQ